MNPDSPFRVKPVKRYRGARYGSESPENFVGYAAWLAWRFPKALVKGAITLLLAAGLTLGMPACDDDTDTASDGDRVVDSDGDRSPQTDGDNPTDSDGDNPTDSDGDNTASDGDRDGDVSQPRCDMQELSCVDETFVKFCNGRDVETATCSEYCVMYFSQDATSEGCETRTPNTPCNCYFPDIDADYEDCMPDQFSCTNDGKLTGCEWRHPDWTCEDYCDQYFGTASEPGGCLRLDRENVCDCHYPAAVCIEDDKRCKDTEHLQTCRSNAWVTQGCDTVCHSLLGQTFEPLYCDVDFGNNPCHCTDTRLTCTQADSYCINNYTLAYCNDGKMERISCDDFCQETRGYDYTSSNCKTDQQDDPCLCYYPVADGDIAEFDVEDFQKNTLPDGDIDAQKK